MVNSKKTSEELSKFILYGTWKGKSQKVKILLKQNNVEKFDLLDITIHYKEILIKIVWI